MFITCNKFSAIADFTMQFQIMYRMNYLGSLKHCKLSR